MTIRFDCFGLVCLNCWFCLCFVSVVIVLLVRCCLGEVFDSCLAVCF